MFEGLLLNPESAKLLEKFSEQPSHAALVTGPSGIGLHATTIQLIKALLGIPGTQSLENAPHARVLEPKDGTIAVETIRAMQPFFALKVPGRAKTKRVVAISGAETLSIEAQNSLLKLLEEPPEGSVLLLSTSEPKRLLATIRSRLSVLLLRVPSKEQIMAWFTKAGFDAASIERAYLMADGAPEQMLAILSGEGTDGFEMARTVLSGNTFERLLQVDALSKDKQAAAAFVASLAQVASASLERAASQNPGRVEQWQSILAASMTAANALDRNGNTKLVLTDLMLTL